MAASVEPDYSTQRYEIDLLQAVATSSWDESSNDIGELRLAVLEWLVDLTVEPALAARAVLDRQSGLRDPALPRALIAILQEIATVNPARYRGRRRRHQPIN